MNCFSRYPAPNQTEIDTYEEDHLVGIERYMRRTQIRLNTAWAILDEALKNKG